MNNLCAPAIIYLIFSITQILIDMFKGLYNTAFMKTIVAATVTLLLNILCKQGLNVVSWIIVFIPFILMTVIVSILLYTFGLDAATGKIQYENNGKPCDNGIKFDKMRNIIIYDPEYNPKTTPVYYKSPNIVVPNPIANDIAYKNKQTISALPYGSSSPMYQS